MHTAAKPLVIVPCAFGKELIFKSILKLLGNSISTEIPGLIKLTSIESYSPFTQPIPIKRIAVVFNCEKSNQLDKIRAYLCSKVLDLSICETTHQVMLCKLSCLEV